MLCCSWVSAQVTTTQADRQTAMLEAVDINVDQIKKAITALTAQVHLAFARMVDAIHRQCSFEGCVLWQTVQFSTRLNDDLTAPSHAAMSHSSCRCEVIIIGTRCLGLRQYHYSVVFPRGCIYRCTCMMLVSTVCLCRWILKRFRTSLATRSGTCLTCCDIVSGVKLRGRIFRGSQANCDHRTLVNRCAVLFAV